MGQCYYSNVTIIIFQSLKKIIMIIISQNAYNFSDKFKEKFLPYSLEPLRYRWNKDLDVYRWIFVKPNCHYEREESIINLYQENLRKKMTFNVTIKRT